MNEFEHRLHETVQNYFIRHQNYPKSISMSYEFRDEIYKLPMSHVPMVNCFGVATERWRNWDVKFVRRKNYMEAFPRRKPNRRRAKNSDYMNMLYSMQYAPVIKMPSLSPMLTSA